MEPPASEGPYSPLGALNLLVPPSIPPVASLFLLPEGKEYVTLLAALQSRCHGNFHSTHLIHTSRLTQSRQRSQTGICPLFSPSCVFQALRNVSWEMRGWAVSCVTRLCWQGKKFGSFRNHNCEGKSRANGEVCIVLSFSCKERLWFQAIWRSFSGFFRWDGKRVEWIPEAVAP